MVRPIFTEFALFITPFVVYAAFLVATRTGVLHPPAWSLARLAWLVIAALLLMIGSFLVFAEFSGEPPNSEYKPAHVEDGHLVPGQTQ